MSTPKRPDFRNPLDKLGGKPGKRAATTRSGSNIRVNRNFTDRAKAKRDMRARKKAEYLATLPKSRVKRILYRLEPRRVARYWFSREGAIMALKLTGIGLAI